MRLLRRRRAEPEPAAEEDRSEEEVPAAREVGPPDPSRVTQGRAPNGQWTSLKDRPEGTRF